MLLSIALSGPWFFDRVNVPAPYECSGPFMRLDENFCGLPVSIARSFPMTIGGLIDMASSLVKGGGDPRDLIYISYLLLLVMPIFSALILILRGDQGRWRVVHLVVLGLAGIGGLFYLYLILSSSSVPLWALWGLWLYISVVISMLLFGSLSLWESRKLAYEDI
jgi:hypothetical protein